MTKTLAFLVLTCTLGCGANHGRETPVADIAQEAVPMTKLATSVEVEVGANNVRMVLHVTNPTNQPVTLEFSSAQKYDFAVLSSDGREVWRWSKDMGFAAALTSQTIPAGATATFSESWQPGTRSGSFTAIAELTSTSHRLAERTEFQIRR
jgi:hypothetical protein